VHTLEKKKTISQYLSQPKKESKRIDLKETDSLLTEGKSDGALSTGNKSGIYTTEGFGKRGKLSKKGGLENKNLSRANMLIVFS